jgi:ATP-dependent Clp protease protease subunit
MADGTEAPLPKEVYGIFAGAIDQQAVARLANMASIAVGGGVQRVHLAFQTAGGSIPDGIALFNLFRSLPIDLVLYNIGSIASAGVIAYLGASERKASTYATFMIHRTVSPPHSATSDKLHAMARSVVLDDERTEAIFHKHLQITQEQWAVHKVADLWLSAEEAKTAALITEIGEFAPPKGMQLFFVGAA